MTREVGQPEAAAHEQVQIAERLVDLLDDLHPQPVGLQVVDSRDEAGGAEAVGPAALFRRFPHAAELAVDRGHFEPGRHLGAHDETERAARHVRQVERGQRHAQTAQCLEGGPVVRHRLPLLRRALGVLRVLIDRVLVEARA